MQEVPLQSGKHVLIIRVRRSWTAPHRVKKNGRFYARREGSKHELDVAGLRQAFLRSESFAERARAFRAERLSMIVGNQTPVVLRQGSKAVLHLIPFDAFDLATQFDADRLKEEEHNLRPLSYHSCYGPTGRYNLDGYVTYVGPGPGEPVLSYVQAFRNGIIEAVEASLLRPKPEGGEILSIAFEGCLIQGLTNYVRMMQGLDVDTPVVVMVSLLGVEGYEISWASESELPKDEMAEYRIDRPDIILPEVILETLEVENKADLLLRPVLDAVWNAAGYSKCKNYNQEGRWEPGWWRNRRQ